VLGTIAEKAGKRRPSHHILYVDGESKLAHLPLVPYAQVGLGTLEMTIVGSNAERAFGSATIGPERAACRHYFARN
jgi:hypothetical protein